MVLLNFDASQTYQTFSLAIFKNPPINSFPIAWKVFHFGNNSKLASTTIDPQQNLQFFLSEGQVNNIIMKCPVLLGQTITIENGQPGNPHVDQGINSSQAVTVVNQSKTTQIAGLLVENTISVYNDHIQSGMTVDLELPQVIYLSAFFSNNGEVISTPNASVSVDLQNKSVVNIAIIEENGQFNIVIKK